MPFNGSGVFVPVAPPAYPAVPGTVIAADHFNTVIQDLMSNGLSRCLTVDGQSAPVAPIPFNGQKLIGLAVGSNPTDAVNYSQISGLLSGLPLRPLPFATAVTLRANAVAFNYALVLGADGGWFWRDASDTAAAEDGGTYCGTVIRDTLFATLGVFKRMFAGPLFSTWFGAKWDGVTAEAALIQAAIDAAGTRGVRNPAGTCNLAGVALTVPSACEFFGADKRSTIFLYTGSSSGILSKTPGSARLFGNNLHDFTIQNTGRPAGSVGLDLTGIDSSDVQRVRAIGFDTGILYGGYGVGAGGYRNYAARNEFVGNNSGVVVVNGANELLLEANEISNNTNFGLDVQLGNSVTSLHNDYESNGVHLRTAADQTRCYFGRMEGATTARYQTTATATNFDIKQVCSGSGAPCQDLGKFTTDDNFGRNAIRGVNLIKNGGLEAWSSGIAVAPDAWTAFQCTAAQDGSAGNFQEGAFSALLTATTIGGVLFQDIVLPTFQQDTRSAFIVVCRVKLGTSTQAAVSLLALNSVNGPLQSMLNMSLVSGKTLVTTPGWQTVFGICYPTSGTGTVKLRVGLQPDLVVGTGTAWFDAVCVMQLNGPTDEFYGGVGELFPLLKNTYTRTAVLNFPNTGALSSNDLDITVPGATLNNDQVLVTPPHLAIINGGLYTAWVSATDTVTVRFCNTTGVAIDPPSGTFRVTVLHF